MFLFPLVSTFLSSFISGSMIARNIGHRGSAVCSIALLFVAFFSSALIWYEVALGSCEVFINLFGDWFTVGSFNVTWTVYIDLYTAHMLLTVTSVSCAVHCYAVVYMRSDPHLNLFMSYLSLFTFFMVVLVCSDNLIMMLVGWEGIHLCPDGFYDLVKVSGFVFSLRVFSEGKNTESGKKTRSSVVDCIQYIFSVDFSNIDVLLAFYFPRRGQRCCPRFPGQQRCPGPATSRIGSHSGLFKQILTTPGLFSHSVFFPSARTTLLSGEPRTTTLSAPRSLGKKPGVQWFIG